MTPEEAVTPVASQVRDDRTVGELLSDLVKETGTLVQKEVRLATVEMTEKATRAGRQMAFIAAGALLGTIALLTLVAALVLGLATTIALWKSSLIVGIALAIIASAVAYKGVVTLRDMTVVPEQTAETLRRDKELLEERAR